MKTSTLFVVLTLSLATGLFVRWTCASLQEMDQLDSVVPSESFIREQEFLGVFHVQVVRIYPKSFNYDLNRLEYSFATRVGSAHVLFSIIDANAVASGWILRERSARSRQYSKNAATTPLVEGHVVTLTFDSARKEVNVVYAPLL